MRLRYDIVDVFTDRPFAGNQLAVVHGAGDLSTEQCLALAASSTSREHLPGAGRRSRYATRIFTPAGEIPFAGHPTLGTAWVLRSRGELGSGEVVQECGAGEIGVRFDGAGGDLVELSAAPRDLVGPLADELAAALVADLGLSMTDLAGPVQVAGCGLTFAHIPVVPEAVARARVSTTPLSDYVTGLETQDPFEGVNLVSVSGSAPSLQVHARVFVPGLSVPEDAATGSAAAGLGIALVAAGLLPEGGPLRHRAGDRDGPPVLAPGSGRGVGRGGDPLPRRRPSCPWHPARSPYRRPDPPRSASGAASPAGAAPWGAGRGWWPAWASGSRGAPRPTARRGPPRLAGRGQPGDPAASPTRPRPPAGPEVQPRRHERRGDRLPQLVVRGVRRTWWPPR